jgi:pyrroline-5-carboxylate reductase
VSATVLHGDKAATLSKSLGVGVTSDNRKAVAEADIVLLCMKPQVIREVLEAITVTLDRRLRSVAKLSRSGISGRKIAVKLNIPVGSVFAVLKKARNGQ